MAASARRRHFGSRSRTFRLAMRLVHAPRPGAVALGMEPLMLPRRSIDAHRVLESDLWVRGEGVKRAMRRLERAEPELAEYVMETAGKLFADLNRSCRSYATARSLHRRAVMLTLVCIETVRRSV